MRIALTALILICRCWHIEQALAAVDTAPKTEVSVSKLDGISDEEKTAVEAAAVDDKLHLYQLPGGNVVVPLLEENPSSTPFTHVMNGKVCNEIQFTLKGLLYRSGNKT